MLNDCHSNDVKANTSAHQNNELDLEKQRVAQPSSALELSTSDADANTPTPPLTIVVSTSSQEALLPKKELLSATSSSDEQCRICQQDKEEVLIELGCHCRGGLANAHRTCIDTWFHTKGSNRCEICQVVAENVAPPQSHHGVDQLLDVEDRSDLQKSRTPKALLQSTLAGFYHPHRGSVTGHSYIHHPRCFCVARKYHHRSYCGAWTWNCVSTCCGVRSGVEFNESIAKGGIKCHHWVLSSYIVCDCLFQYEK
ncbi:uncharacterized protein LOC111469084 isoform X2 [Cucurbita maxima]|uniref:Uncharacterized protein LOC111469084 isoform X2 n=1 Tax=Cucurbita maxima TaxID=3661 RepID=A0A6J1I4H6_CUCMA|nr:uncharacterized protein LOC111469084 isoform X2 [Cucurbita maxima]